MYTDKKSLLKSNLDRKTGESATFIVVFDFPENSWDRYNEKFAVSPQTCLFLLQTPFLRYESSPTHT